MSQSQLLANHYRQLRTARGTVLLGPAPDDETGRVDPSWFVDGCPLDPSAAVAAIATRHDLGDRRSALEALWESRRELQTAGGAGAEALADLPEL